MIYDVLKVTGTGIWQKMGCDPNSIKNSFRKEPLFFCSYHQGDFYFPPYAAAASLQSCPTLCDPIDRSPPGSPSLGFSRQEHWSGLPCPSPMHESEKSK